MRSTGRCCRRRSGEPEPAPLERSRAQGTAVTLGQVLDGSPADVAAAGAFGIDLPQRVVLGVPVTTAAEALDHECLHGPIVLGRGTRASPGRVIPQGATVVAQASWESGPFPVHASATRPAVESIPM